MPTSWQARYLTKKVLPPGREIFTKVFPSHSFAKKLPVARKLFENMPRLPTAPGIDYEPTTCYGVPAEIVRGSWMPLDKAILFFHGGGYVILNPEFYRSYTSHLSLHCGVPVVALDYRLSPEHVYPAAVNDGMKAYEFLLNTLVIKPENIVLGGDSAGGNLTVVTLMNIKKQGLPMPKAAVCLSPWLDLAGAGPSHTENKHSEALLPPALISAAAEVYRGSASSMDPFISPVFAQPEHIQGFPPMLFHAVDIECFRDDTLTMVRKLKAEGVDVTYRMWQDLFHVFQIFYPLLPESEEAMDEISAFVRKHLRVHLDKKRMPKRRRVK